MSSWLTRMTRLFVWTTFSKPPIAMTTTTKESCFFFASSSSSSSSCDWWREDEDDPIFRSMSYRRCLSTVGHDDVENAICEHGVSISHLLAHMIASSLFSPAGCCLSNPAAAAEAPIQSAVISVCAPDELSIFYGTLCLRIFPLWRRELCSAQYCVSSPLGENRVCSSPRRTGYSS